jgi:hypothetical protein
MNLTIKIKAEFQIVGQTLQDITDNKIFNKAIQLNLAIIRIKI